MSSSGASRGSLTPNPPPKLKEITENPDFLAFSSLMIQPVPTSDHLPKPQTDKQIVTLLPCLFY